MAKTRPAGSPLTPTTVASLVASPFDIFARWKLTRDDKDAVKIDRELQRKGLPPDSLERLLVAGEAVAAAYASQVKWKEDGGARYQKLAQVALQAGQVALQLKELIPPPWTGERERIGALVASLEDFLFSGVEATLFRQHLKTIYAAEIAFAALRDSVPARRVSDALVGRLAWLAGHKSGQQLLGPNAMRPYQGGKRPHGTRARGIWRRNVDILKTVASGASGNRSRAFRDALETWLQAT